MRNMADFHELAAVIMKTASVRLQKLGLWARQQVVAFAQEASQRSAQRMHAIAEHSAAAAKLVTKRSLQARQAALASSQECAVLVAECRARMLEQARKAWPVLQHRATAMRHALKELQHTRALQLQRPEDVPTFADSVSDFREAVDALVSGLHLMPTPAVAVVIFLSLRLVSALNNLADVVITELLQGRTTLSRLILLVAVAPGWLAVLLYREVFIEDWPKQPLDPLPVETLQAEQLHAAKLLALNARRLPNAFWLATSMSAAVTLRAIQEASLQALRVVLRVRLRVLLGVALACAIARGRGKQRGREAFAHIAAAFPPAMVKTMSTGWYHLQAISRSAFETTARAPGSSVRLIGPGNSSTPTDANIDVVEHQVPVFHGQSSTAH